jgi:hypothetical protein
MLRSAEQVLAISSDQGFSQWLAVGNILHGWCLGTTGHAAEGIQRLLKWIAISRGADAKIAMPFFLMTLAEVCGQAGQPEEGLKRLAEAADLVEMTKNVGPRPKFIGCGGRCYCRFKRTPLQRIAISERLRSRANSKQNSGSFGPP